jgi:hypothetical protein
VRPQENTNTSSSRIGERTLPQGTIIRFTQR